MKRGQFYKADDLVAAVHQAESGLFAGFRATHAFGRIYAGTFTATPAADAISISPWRVTEAHRPLGNIMRARKEAYRESSTLRHQANHQVRKEPSNLAEVFGR